MCPSGAAVGMVFGGEESTQIDWAKGISLPKRSGAPLDLNDGRLLGGFLGFPDLFVTEFHNGLCQWNEHPCLTKDPGWHPANGDPGSFQELQACCLNIWHPLHFRMYQILQHQEQARQHIIHTIVPSTGTIRVVCRVVIEHFCLSLQHFLQWKSTFSFVALFYVCVDSTCSEAWQKIQPGPKISEPRQLDMEEQGTEKATSTSHCCQVLWMYHHNEASQGILGWVPLELFMWLLATLLQGRRSRH
jgi:hypothetical protein